MTTKTIKVVIHERAIQGIAHQAVLAEMRVIDELKKRGIPVASYNNLTSRGVSCGVLKQWREHDLNDEIEYHFEWTGPELKAATINGDDDDEL